MMALKELKSNARQEEEESSREMESQEEETRGGPSRLAEAMFPTPYATLAEAFPEGLESRTSGSGSAGREAEEWETSSEWSELSDTFSTTSLPTSLKIVLPSMKQELELTPQDLLKVVQAVEAAPVVKVVPAVEEAPA